jgi:hypothetical protein
MLLIVRLVLCLVWQVSRGKRLDYAVIRRINRGDGVLPLKPAAKVNVGAATRTEWSRTFTARRRGRGSWLSACGTGKLAFSRFSHIQPQSYPGSTSLGTVKPDKTMRRTGLSSAARAATPSVSSQSAMAGDISITGATNVGRRAICRKTPSTSLAMRPERPVGKGCP